MSDKRKIENVYDLLNPEERRRLRDDLAEIKRRRMIAEDALRDWPQTDPRDV